MCVIPQKNITTFSEKKILECFAFLFICFPQSIPYPNLHFIFLRPLLCVCVFFCKVFLASFHSCERVTKEPAEKKETKSYKNQCDKKSDKVKVAGKVRHLSAYDVN